MTSAQWLGLVIAIWGRRRHVGRRQGPARAGWAMGLAAQPVWVAFALTVHSWPLLFSPLLYGTVYARNLWRWWRRSAEDRAWEAKLVAELPE